MAKKEVVKERASSMKENPALEAPEDDENIDEIFSGLESESE